MKQSFDLFVDGFTLKAHEQPIMVTEPHDIERALEVLKDAQSLLERGLINDRDFLWAYTTIAEDNLYFQLNEVDFPVLFSVASMMKYGSKDLVNRLVEFLKENVNEEMTRVVVEPN